MVRRSLFRPLHEAGDIVKICVLNEAQAWRVEHEGCDPKLFARLFWSLGIAIKEVNAGRARFAKRNGVVLDRVIVLTRDDLDHQDEGYFWNWNLMKSQDYFPVLQARRVRNAQ